MELVSGLFAELPNLLNVLQSTMAGASLGIRNVTKILNRGLRK